MAKVFKVPPAAGLDLTPIMNMVLVLIPLMLLSVVFLTITVIDVTMPQRSAGAASDSGEPPKRLQVVISRQGFLVFDGPTARPPITGCQEGGVTVCVPSSKEKEEIETNRHDWAGLYNELLKVKSQPGWNEHETIEIVADPKIPFATVVKVMDVARFQLAPAEDAKTATKGVEMKTAEALDKAEPVKTEVMSADGNSVSTNLPMFPLVVLGLPVSQ